MASRTKPPAGADAADTLASILREFLSTAMAPPPTAAKRRGTSAAPKAAPKGEDEEEDDEMEDDDLPLPLPMPMKGGRRVTISILMPSKGMLKKRLSGK